MEKRGLFQDIDQILAHTTENDFDGHSDFLSLSPAERLDWLDEVAGFVLEFKGSAGQGMSPEST